MRTLIVRAAIAAGLVAAVLSYACLTGEGAAPRPVGARLAALARDFAATTPRDADRQLELAREAVKLGASGMRLLGDWMFSPEHDSRFQSSSARRQFCNRVAQDLRRLYLDGPRRGKFDRRGPYEIKFDWQKPLATTTDEHGEQWALIGLWWYGTRFDLWLIHSADGKTWSYPLFTGLARIATWDRTHQTRLEVRGGKAKISYPRCDIDGDVRRVTGVETEIRLADLTRDSDGDGIYDVEEQRLRTDPAEPDTDRDGLADGEDRNPLVGRNPRQLTDEQAIRQVIFRCHAPAETRVTIVQAEPSERQEYVGSFGGIVLSLSKPEIEELGSESGEEVFHFSFDDLRFDPTRTQATVKFTDFRAPLAAHGFTVSLRKLAPGLWCITDLTHPWIS